MAQSIFFVLATIIVLASLMVVFSDNPIHSVLFLFVVLFAMAGLYFLLNAPFLAAGQGLIYCGAITVLILFVVMLTSPYIPSVRLLESKQSDAALLVVALFFAALAQILRTSSWFDPGLKSPPKVLETAAIGEILFKQYVL